MFMGLAMCSGTHCDVAPEALDLCRLLEMLLPQAISAPQLRHPEPSDKHVRNKDGCYTMGGQQTRKAHQLSSCHPFLLPSWLSVLWPNLLLLIAFWLMHSSRLVVM